MLETIEVGECEALWNFKIPNRSVLGLDYETVSNSCIRRRRSHLKSRTLAPDKNKHAGEKQDQQDKEVGTVAPTELIS